MLDFLLDPLTGDLDFGDGNKLGLQLVPDDITDVVQRINQSFDISIGEWFADISVYIPYIKNNSESLFENIRFILGDKISEKDVSNYIKHIFDTHLINLPFVKNFTSNYSFDKEKRIFTYNYDATVTLDNYETAVVSSNYSFNT